MPAIKIRTAVESDCPAINSIYNHYVLHSTTTYQTEPETLEGRTAWLALRGGPHPVTIAEVDGVVVGWGALSRFHPRAAYSRTVENAVYIAHDRVGRGIGKAVLLDLIDRAKQLEHHTIIALISSEQAASLALHAKVGFERVGLLKEAGFKMNQWLDVVYMQKLL
jgi:L-amino acid N-acyltransferase YncA